MQNYNSKCKIKNKLERAVEFHGHLGPYLVLGLLMGDLAVNMLKCKKHFGIETRIRGAIKKPKSCLIDGIQISTGCTYGKGNVQKLAGNKIEVLFHNKENDKKLRIRLKDILIERLNRLDGHKESEIFAKQLLRLNPVDLFDLKF